MKIIDVVSDWIIMPQTIKPQGLTHKKGHGPNNRFGFRNVGNNRANENLTLTADQLKQLQTEYTPYKDRALPAVKGHVLRQFLKSLSDEDLSLLTKTDIPHVSLKAQIMLDLHRYSRIRGPIKDPFGNVEDAAGVGIITKQNTTRDVKPGEIRRQARKLKLV